MASQWPRVPEPNTSIATWQAGLWGGSSLGYQTMAESSMCMKSQVLTLPASGSESEGRNKPAILPSLPDVCNTAIILL